MVGVDAAGGGVAIAGVGAGAAPNSEVDGFGLALSSSDQSLSESSSLAILADPNSEALRAMGAVAGGDAATGCGAGAVGTIGVVVATGAAENELVLPKSDVDDSGWESGVEDADGASDTLRLPKDATTLGSLEKRTGAGSGCTNVATGCTSVAAGFATSKTGVGCGAVCGPVEIACEPPKRSALGVSIAGAGTPKRPSEGAAETTAAGVAGAASVVACSAGSTGEGIGAAAPGSRKAPGGGRVGPRRLGPVTLDIVV